MKPLIKLLPLFIIIMAICSFTRGHAKAGKATAPATDSVIMRQHILEVKLSALGELKNDEADITEARLDSMLSSVNVSIAGTGIFSTPDGKLKIFIITEEFCGAYCNYGCTSYVHLRNGKQLKGANQLHSIDSIYQLPDGKYLLIQSWGERAFSACSDIAIAGSVISTTADSVILHPAIFKPTGNSADTVPIEFRTAYIVDSPTYLHYNPLTHIIQYQHGNPCGYYNNQTDIHTGYFIYQHGTFIQVKDSVWTPPVDDK